MLAWLINWITKFYAVLATVPFLSFLLVWFLAYYVTRDKKKSTGFAADITTLLLIGCVSSMYYRLFDSSFGFYAIVFLMLLSFGIIGNIQYRTRGEIDHKRAVRIILRIGFLALGAIYLLFLFIGIVRYFIAT